MAIPIFFAPVEPQDGETPVGAASTPAPGTPRIDIDLAAVADAVAAKWTSIPEIKLL